MKSLLQVLHCCLFVLLLPVCLNAQEEGFLRMGNYSGINGIILNPATPVAAYPLNWDLNLASSSFFVQNNYAFIYNTSLLDLSRNYDNLEEFSSENTAGDLNQGLFYDFADGNQTDKFIYNKNLIGGPSLLINLAKHSFGIFTNWRTHIYAGGIDPNLAFPDFDNQVFDESFPVKSFDLSMAHWTEIGLHYGHNFNEQFSAGINAKILQPRDAFFLSSKEDFELIKASNDTLYFSQVDIDYGFAHNFNFENDTYQRQTNGNGFSFDLGVNYILPSSNENKAYDLRLGASLLDIGFLNFNSNSQTHNLSSAEQIWIHADDFRFIQNDADLVELISEQTLGDVATSSTDASFALFTPMAVSLQADYSLTSFLYVNAQWVQRLKFTDKTLARTNSLSIAPRFESRWFELGTALTIFDYKEIIWGASARLGFLTVGTENLASLFIPSTFNGTDFYVALKINPFSFGSSKEGRFASKKDKKKKIKNKHLKAGPSVSCPKF